MKLFELLDKIDSLIYQQEQKEHDNLLLTQAGEGGTASALRGQQSALQSFTGSAVPEHGAGFAGGGTPGHGAGFAGGNVPWVPSSPIAHKTDFDNDGIADNIDQHYGPGAVKGENVAWNPASPIAHKTDFDHDGIPDNLDQHHGPAAFKGGNVPWNPQSPIANKTDFDHDGIADDIDQENGPGGFDPDPQ